MKIPSRMRPKTTGLLLAIALTLVLPVRTSAADSAADVKAEQTEAGVATEEAADASSTPSVLDDSGERDELRTLERLSLLGKVIRVRFRSRFLPGAEFGSSEVDRWSPEVRLRVRFPITKKAVGRITTHFRSDRYDVNGGSIFGGPTLPSGTPDNFYSASVNLEAAHTADFMPKIFSEDEVWSLIGGVSWHSRWAQGAFDEGITGGGLLGFSYSLTDRLRILLALGLTSRLGRSGVKFAMTGSLHWKISERWKIRTRGLGAQLEYAIIRPVSIFATGYRHSRSFALDQTTAQGDTLVFRDRTSAMVGGGFKWQITKRLRLIAEGGAVIGRKLRARADGDNIVSSMKAAPHGYFDLRLIAGR